MRDIVSWRQAKFAAAPTRKRRGERRPETFAFLDFTHYCGKTRDGRFIVKHKTQSKRLTRKLTALRQEAWRLMHRPLAEQHRWYVSVLRGHYGYFGMPHNWRALNGFLRQVRRIWFNCPRRRSRKNRRKGWAWFEDLTSRLPLPRPRELTPGHHVRHDAGYSGKSRVRETRMPGSVRAKPNGRATRPRPLPGTVFDLTNRLGSSIATLTDRAVTGPNA
jgi:hypothetical protein